MCLNIEVINHLPSIIRTVTSRRLECIKFALLESSPGERFDYPDEWELIDTEICHLVDQIRSPGREGWRLSVKFIATSATDSGAAGKPAAQLLPACSQHKYITISTDHGEFP